MIPNCVEDSIASDSTFTAPEPSVRPDEQLRQLLTEFVDDPCALQPAHMQGTCLSLMAAM